MTKNNKNMLVGDEEGCIKYLDSQLKEIKVRFDVLLSNFPRKLKAI
jgi:hypothetical protein